MRIQFLRHAHILGRDYRPGDFGWFPSRVAQDYLRSHLAEPADPFHVEVRALFDKIREGFEWDAYDLLAGLYAVAHPELQPIPEPEPGA